MLQTAQRLTAFAASVAVLCLPAIWNGFPLLFDDVGGYLERWPTGTLGNGRSAVFGLLLSATAWAWWVPVVLLQAIVTTWVIDRALQVTGLHRSPWLLAAAVTAIAATSGAALFVSQVMPDAWAAPAVLALHLLAWHADRLSMLERVALAVIVAFAGAAHQATLGVLVGMSLLHTAAWALRARLGIAPVGVANASLAAWSGFALLLAVNLLVAGDLALTPGGKVFWFGRLVESGIVGKVLHRECPRPDWALCGFRDQMPTTADDFLWTADSPLYQLGGWDDPGLDREIASIMGRSLLTQPFEHLKSALALTAQQLVLTGAPDSMGRIESWHNLVIIDTYAPWLSEPYARSRQQQDALDTRTWSVLVIAPVSLAASFALPFGALWTWRHGRRREALLLAMVFFALLGNALLCGVMSGPHARYQARLVWLAPLGLAIALGATRRHGLLVAAAAS